MPYAFWIGVRRQGNTLLVTPHGAIDHRAEPELARVLAVLPVDGRLVVLDMRGVPFMDLTGLHFLVRLHRRVQENGQQLTGLGWQSQPRRLLNTVLERDHAVDEDAADRRPAARDLRRALRERAAFLRERGRERPRGSRAPEAVTEVRRWLPASLEDLLG
ncbi:STAS domain-containing protein [Streptomyces sp. NPDC046557]|uniref:STAS domain-containing protein n=1 Tax=Streptomyces sp. NPDC046557 TaxID=3155372 RepID=UPI0033DC0016